MRLYIVLVFAAVALTVLGFAIGKSNINIAEFTNSSLSVLDSEVAVAEQDGPKKWSPTKPFPVHDVYYPGTETLGPDEMRVIACGTGMPQPRLKQAAACYVVELGNGDKFVFDMGEGSFERIMALGIPLDQLDKVSQTPELPCVPEYLQTPLPEVKNRSETSSFPAE